MFLFQTSLYEGTNKEYTYDTSSSFSSLDWTPSQLIKLVSQGRQKDSVHERKEAKQVITKEDFDSKKKQ